MRFQFGIVLEAVHQQSSAHNWVDLLHVPLPKILTHETFIVLASHMHKEFINTEERFMAELPLAPSFSCIAFELT